MAELNFGLLTPPGTQSIGNAFTQGMDQAQESRARDLQMQQSVRKGQMDELTYRKALDTEARLNKYYSNIAANGGPKTPEEAIQAMLGSGVPHIQDLAAKLQIETLKNNQQLALYRAANTGPSTTPTAVAAPMAPEPGSFGADVATRRAADMFAPPPERTNMMPGAAAAAAPAGVNSLATLEQRIAANMALGTEQGYKTAEILRKQADTLGKRYVVGHTLMGGEGSIYGTAPEKPPAKTVAKSGNNPNFGTNMPMMSSAFDTAMWLSAA